MIYKLSLMTEFCEERRKNEGNGTNSYGAFLHLGLYQHTNDSPSHCDDSALTFVP